MNSPIRLIRYSLPLRNPFYSASGRIVCRTGLLLGYPGKYWSEIAPLPGFSGETTTTALFFLRKHAVRIHKAVLSEKLDDFLQLTEIQPYINEMPSVRFGLSMLAEQQKAMEAALPLYAMWSCKYGTELDSNPVNTVRDRHFFTTETEKNLNRRNTDKVTGTPAAVTSNAIAGLKSAGNLYDQVNRCRDEGYSTIKIKLPSDPRPAGLLVKKIASSFPDLRFRFDANAAYTRSQIQLLIKNAASSGSLTLTEIDNLEYVEEPLRHLSDRQGYPDCTGLARLREQGMRVAVDEGARNETVIREILDAGAADSIVVKPMLTGSFSDLLRIVQRCRFYRLQKSNVLPLIISSSFETAVGRRLLAHVAAFVNRFYSTAHGLATAGFFSADVYGSGAPCADTPYILLLPEPGAGFNQKEWLNTHVLRKAGHPLKLEELSWQ